MSVKPTIQINWSQVITSLVLGAILGAFTLLRLSDTQTVVLAGHTKTIEKLEASSVSHDIFDQHVSQQSTDMQDIKTALRDLNNKVDSLLRR